MLSVVDEYTREVHALHVERHIGAKKVCEVMEQLIAQHGAPDYIRSDNGPEFVAHLLRDWLEKAKIKTLYIDPGSPWQNGYVESFHDKFRRECLGREMFYTLSESRVVIGDWRKKFNQIRPHRSLSMRTPQEFASASLHPFPGGGEVLRIEDVLDHGSLLRVSILPSVAALKFTSHAGVIGWLVRHGVDSLLIGSALHRVRPPATLLCFCTPARFLIYYGVG